MIEAFADHILQLDDSIPNGTYIDMCNNLPVVDPRQIKVPTIIMRGEYDGIAGFKDLLNFFELLPNPDKQFAVMPGIAHASLQQKNYMIALHIMHASSRSRSRSTGRIGLRAPSQSTLTPSRPASSAIHARRAAPAQRIAKKAQAAPCGMRPRRASRRA